MEDKGLKKYEELYALARDIYGEERTRSESLDEKASRYLGILTILLAGFGFFSKTFIRMMIPPAGLMDWLWRATLLRGDVARIDRGDGRCKDEIYRGEGIKGWGFPLPFPVHPRGGGKGKRKWRQPWAGSIDRVWNAGHGFVV